MREREKGNKKERKRERERTIKSHFHSGLIVDPFFYRFFYVGTTNYKNYISKIIEEEETNLK